VNDITRILHNWGLGDAAVTPVEHPENTTWEVDGKYILKRYRSADDLSRSIELSGLLTSHGIPVTTFIPAKNGKLSSPDGEYCLMTKLPGKHADFYKEPPLAHVMGRELARLHTALADIESKTSCHDSNLFNDWNTQIKPCLGDVPVDLVKNIDAEFCEAFPKLPRQLIHRDVHQNNVLFEGKRLSGWLDFDISHRNIRIFDISYLLSGLLIGNTGNTAKIESWYLICDNLINGYDEVNPLAKHERESIPVIMILIEFLFVWYWEQQGNAEQRDIANELAAWLYNKKATPIYCIQKTHKNAGK